ncbi:MAG: hypothetical protein JXK05_04080 [Campylobacterales bacterium]|nr:hypothetical protein [Campylobacterales bacterium]
MKRLPVTLMLAVSLIFGASNLSTSFVYDTNLTLHWTAQSWVSLYERHDTTYYYEGNETVEPWSETNTTTAFIATLDPEATYHTITGLSPAVEYTLIIEEDDANATIEVSTTHTWNEVMSVCATGKPVPPTAAALQAMSSFSCSGSGAVSLEAVRDLRNVTKLVMRGDVLDAEIPSWISELSQLRTLILSGSRLRGAIPATIGDLQHIEIIDLAQNELTKLPPEIAQLSTLKELHVASNRLVQRLDDLNMSGLVNLEKLYMQNNRLYGRVNESFFALPKLQKLRLNQNNLQITVPYVAVDLNLTQPNGLGLHENCRVTLAADNNETNETNETAAVQSWIDAKASLYRGYLGTQQTGGNCWTPMMVPILMYLLDETNTTDENSSSSSSSSI